MNDDPKRRPPRRQRKSQAVPTMQDLIPDPQPPVTEADIRRVKELIEKYGWQHLRDKD